MGFQAAPAQWHCVRLLDAFLDFLIPGIRPCFSSKEPSKQLPEPDDNYSNDGKYSDSGFRTHGFCRL
jgi:hypothetical protein